LLCQSVLTFVPVLPLIVDDYKQHTSCVTEAERYEKTVYKGPKKNETKGRKLTPQESWMEIINDSFEKCPPAATSYLETLSSYDNVPRKEKAFRNFAANSLNLRGAHGDAIVSSIWSHLSSVREEKLKDQAKLKEQEQAVIETSKEKVETDTESASNAQAKKATSINETKVGKKVVKAMRKALKKAPSNQLKMKELRKLVKCKLDSEDKEVTKDDVKKAIKTVIAEENSISVDGKLVKLTQ